VKNILQVLSFDVVGKGLLALTGALLIRYMPQSEYVAYSVAYSLLLVFVQVCSGSLSRIFLVRHRSLTSDADISVFVCTQLLLICAAVPVLIVIVGARTGLAWICAGSLLTGCLAEIAKSRFQRDLRFRRFSLVESGRAVLTFGAVCALAWWQGHHLRAIQMQAVNLFAMTLIVGLNRLPRVGRITRESWAAIRAFASQLLTGSDRNLFTYFCLVAIFGQVDLLLLKVIGTEHQVATYASAYRYYNILLLALNAINTVLFPAIQRIQSMNESAELKRIHRVAMAIFIPGVVICMCLAQRVMPVIDRSRYPGAPAVFYILALSSIASLIFSPYLNYVMRFEDFQFLLQTLCIALVVGVALNILLVRSLGAVGTACSLLLSTAILNVSGYLRCSRYRTAPAELATA
jgi:O-antigen/teichoic acid export membrane protein